MAKAGADIIVCHLGLTTGGTIGAETALKLTDCPALVDDLGGGRAAQCAATSSCSSMAARSPKPADADFVMKKPKNCHGFYGASSMERLPIEVALTEQTRKFKLIGRQRG